MSKLIEELTIQEDNLNEEIMFQPLLFRKYTQIKAKMSSKVKILHEKLRRAEATHRIRLKSDADKKTVKDLDSLVTLEPEIIALRHEIIEAEELQEEYEGIVRSFYQRHDALKELLANKRKELGV